MTPLSPASNPISSPLAQVSSSTGVVKRIIAADLTIQADECLVLAYEAEIASGVTVTVEDGGIFQC